MALTPEEARSLLDKMDGSQQETIGSMSPEIARNLLSQMGNGQQQPPSPTGETPELPSQGVSEGQGIMPMIAALLSGGKRGLGELGTGAAGMAAQGVDRLAGTQLQQQVPQYHLQGIDQKIAQAHPSMAETGSIVSKVAPLLFAPEFGGGLAGQMAGQAAVGGLEGAIESPEDRIKGLLAGGASAAAGPLAGKAITATARATKGATQKALSKMVGGTKSVKDMAKFDEAAERLGVDIPAAQRVDSPGLKRIQETLLSKLPFSGMHKAVSDVGDKITSHMNSLLSKLNPSGERAGSLVKNELQGKYDALEKSASDKYDRVSAILSKKNPPHDIKSMVDEASKIKKQISRDASFGGKSVSDYKELKPILDSLENSPVKNIGDAFKTDKIINARMRDAEGLEKKMLSQLKSVNKDAISKTVKKYGSDDLNSQYNVANNFYKKVFAPFRDNEEIAKILHKDTKIDEVVPTVFGTSGTKGKSDILESVAPHLSQDSKNAILNEHLSTQLEQPEKKVLSKISKYEKIQKRQKDMLIAPEDRQLLDDMRTIKEHMGDTSFNKMFVEKTGASLQPYAAASLLGTAGMATGGVPGALAAILGGVGGGRLAKKAVMSDVIPAAYRKALQQSGKSPEAGRVANIAAKMAKGSAYPTYLASKRKSKDKSNGR